MEDCETTGHKYGDWRAHNDLNHKRECENYNGNSSKDKCRSVQEYRWYPNHESGYVWMTLNDHHFGVSARAIYFYADHTYPNDLLPGLKYQLEVSRKLPSGYKEVLHRPPEKFSLSEIMKQVRAAIDSLELTKPT